MARYQCSDMLADLKALDQFLVARLAAGACILDIAKGQLESMKAKAKELKGASVEQLLELTTAVESMGKVWTKDQQLELTTCLSKLVMPRSAPKRNGKNASDVFQSCLFQYYLDDWRVEKMQDQTTSRDGCISIVSEGAKMLGLEHPDEHTYGRMVACVAVIGLNDHYMDVGKLHALLEDIKTEHKKACENFNSPYAFLKDYPSRPNELDIQRLEYAYPHGTNFTKTASYMGNISHICSQKFLRRSASGVAKSMRSPQGLPAMSSGSLVPMSPSQATGRNVPVIDLPLSGMEPQVQQNPMLAMCAGFMQNTCQIMMQGSQSGVPPPDIDASITIVVCECNIIASHVA